MLTPDAETVVRRVIIKPNGDERKLVKVIDFRKIPLGGPHLRVGIFDKPADTIPAEIRKLAMH